MFSKMKQYTTPEQTAKLIELGFKKPKGSHRYWRENELIINNNYSIGELIEMLPKKVRTQKGDDTHLDVAWDNIGWRLDYSYFGSFLYTSMNEELVDAIYDMIVKLKEEGVT